jgi:hypothetical protein
MLHRKRRKRLFARVERPRCLVMYKKWLKLRELVLGLVCISVVAEDNLCLYLPRLARKTLGCGHFIKAVVPG